MGKSKHRKDHKKKSSARKAKVQSDKNRVQKMQREFIMNMIKKEQDMGLFETANSITPNDVTITEGPII
jgi:hypothetical protein